MPAPVIQEAAAPLPRGPWGSGEPQSKGPGKRRGAAHLPAGSRSAIAAEYLPAASANCPLRNSSLPWLFRPAGLSGAAGVSAPGPPPGCPVAPPPAAAAAEARRGLRLSAPASGVWPRRGAPLAGRLPPSALPVSFFWMLPMAHGWAARAAPAGSAGSVGKWMREVRVCITGKAAGEAAGAPGAVGGLWGKPGRAPPLRAELVLDDLRRPSGQSAPSGPLRLPEDSAPELWPETYPVCNCLSAEGPVAENRHLRAIPFIKPTCPVRAYKIRTFLNGIAKT